MRRALWLLPFALLATGASAGPPRKAPVRNPALVKAGRAPAYYDPAHLEREPVLSASAALVMDYDTGEVLWARNPDARRYPASTTKILTALLFVENVPPDEIVACNDAAIGKVGESSLHIKPGERFPAEDLLKGFLLRSANDGGVVIAQRVAGSVPRFAQRMNARAAELGATHSHFVNPHGLHDPAHVTTARDLAILARAAMANERFAAAVRTPSATIRRSISGDRRVVAKSKRLFYDKVPGADGIKTGYTRPAGHCFVGSATRDGRRLIAVILGAKSSACQETIPLLEWGFRRFPSRVAASAGQPVGAVAIRGGATPTVAGRLSAPLRVVSDRIRGEGEVALAVEPQGARAPIRPGDTIARYVARRDSRVVAAVDVVAAGAVEAKSVSATVGGPWAMGLLFGGAGCGLLIRWRHGRRRSASAAAQGARRRRSRVAADSRSVDRRRPR